MTKRKKRKRKEEKKKPNMKWKRRRSRCRRVSTFYLPSLTQAKRINPIVKERYSPATSDCISMITSQNLQFDRTFRRDVKLVHLSNELVAMLNENKRFSRQVNFANEERERERHTSMIYRCYYFSTRVHNFGYALRFYIVTIRSINNV